MTVKVVVGLFTNLSSINIMTKAHSQDRTSSEAIAKFWNRYIHAVEKFDVPEYQRRWYMIRAKEYVKTNRDTPLRDQNPDYVSRYLEELGRKKHLKDWQFMQIIHALKILFVTMQGFPPMISESKVILVNDIISNLH